MDRANRGRRLPFAAPLRSGHRSRPRPRPELVCDGRGISSENETSWTQRAGPASHGRLATLPEQLRSEEHTSELQSRLHLVCRLLLEKKNDNNRNLCTDRAGVQALVEPPRNHPLRLRLSLPSQIAHSHTATNCSPGQHCQRTQATRTV